MADREKQRQIIAELQVVQDFDVVNETERRITFLADYLTHTQTHGYVLGISGGVDSTVAGRLAQLACERVRQAGGQARFVAMRLPYHVQRDEADARDAVEFIAADEVLTINIGPATDALWDATVAVAGQAGMSDFVKGNVKARQRMIAQYAVAGARRMLVIGTDQAAESAVGFYTKFGDGAADLSPLAGLPKRRVKQIGRHLGAAEHLVEKVPTADLEAAQPLQPDEEALGVSYAEVDDYLEGKTISPQSEQIIVNWHTRTAHKRALPLTPQDFESRS